MSEPRESYFGILDKGCLSPESFAMTSGNRIGFIVADIWINTGKLRRVESEHSFYSSAWAALHVLMNKES